MKITCSIIVVMLIINNLYSQNQTTFKVQKNKQEEKTEIITELPQDTAIIPNHTSVNYEVSLTYLIGTNYLHFSSTGLYKYINSVFYKYYNNIYVEDNHSYRSNTSGHIISFSLRIINIDRINSVEYASLGLFMNSWGGNCPNDFKINNLELDGYYIVDNFNILPDIFRKQRWIDFRHYIGFGYGNYSVKMSDSLDNEQIFYTNPAFLLSTKIELKLNLIYTKNFSASFGCDAGYLLDVSKSKWIKKDKVSIDLPDIHGGDKMSGFYWHGLFSLNFAF